jgi:sugar lactone lactonase YvrE
MTLLSSPLTALSAAALLGAAAVFLAPARRRLVAIGAALALVAAAASAPAFGAFTTNPAANPHPVISNTFAAETVGTPSGLACTWTAGTTIALDWSNSSSWANTSVARSANGGSFTDPYAAVAAGASTANDTAANSPTANTYTYKAKHYSSSWYGGFSDTVTSTTCTGAIAQLVPGGASASRLNNPYDIAFDSSGNLYIADKTNAKVRKVSTSGVITTIAGTGTAGSSADGTTATSAQIGNISGLAVDADGDVFIADTSNHVVWEVNNGGSIQYGAGAMTSGKIYRVAGTVGQSGSSGDGGAARSAKLNAPQDVAVDSSGNLYISDTGNHTIRKVTGDSTGNVALFAGTAGQSGSTGDGGAATAAKLNNPAAVAVDSAGDVFVADTTNNEIRQIYAAGGRAGNIAAVYGGGHPAAGNIYRIAGTGTAGTDTDGTTATSAKLDAPIGLDVDGAGNILVGDNGNHLVRVVFANTTSGYGITSPSANAIYTIAGTGNTAYSGPGYPAIGTGAANVGDTYGVAVDPVNAANVYVSDYTKHIVRKVDTTHNLVFTAAGVSGSSGSAGDGSLAVGWEFVWPLQGTVDASGNVWFADWFDNRIREWVASTGQVRTVAGTGAAGSSGDGGNALAAALWAPYSVALDSTGNLYIADGVNHKVRKVTITNGVVGNISTVAGSGTACSAAPCGDGGAATSAQLNSPRDVAIDGDGNIIISDFGNCAIRFVSPNGGTYYGSSRTAGYMYTIAGTLRSCGSAGDGGAATSATLNGNEGIDVDADGNIYIAEASGVKIREVAGVSATQFGQSMTANSIYTIAGTGSSCGSADGAATTTATFCNPYDVAYDSATSTVYVADTGNRLIRKLTGTTVSTLAGSAGTASDTGNGGWAGSATLNVVYAVMVRAGGDLFLTQTAYADLRRIYGPDP